MISFHELVDELDKIHCDFVQYFKVHGKELGIEPTDGQLPIYLGCIYNNTQDEFTQYFSMNFHGMIILIAQDAVTINGQLTILATYIYDKIIG